MLECSQGFFFEARLPMPRARSVTPEMAGARAYGREFLEAGEFSGEQSLGQGSIAQDAEPLLLAGGQDFGFDSPHEEIVREFVQRQWHPNGQRFRHLDHSEIADAEVADFALASQVIESVERLLDSGRNGKLFAISGIMAE